MKVLLFSLAVICVMAWAVEAQRWNPPPRQPPRPFKLPHRFRREPQGSVQLEAIKPLDGPDKRPTLNLDYNHRLIDDGKTTLDAFGGGSLHGNRVAPQLGLNYEHNFNKDMFLRGQGAVQPGPTGGISPSFGAQFGWRFRREALPYEEEEFTEEAD